MKKGKFRTEHVSSDGKFMIPAAMIVEAGKCENGVVKSFVVDPGDIKRIGVDGDVITSINKKRKGTYGHRGKNGPRYFGRETTIYEY